jgi:carboxymethylenebutenolidase
MASSETFASAHLSPAPLNYVAERGTMIELECSDGKKGNAFLVKADSTTNNWLFVFHEWWGLNDYIKREAERLAGELRNVNVLAIDLYDGQVTDKSENAQKIMQSIKDDRARALINGAIAHAGKDAKIGTIGWCFGGGWSLQASIMAGKQAVACVMYYGFPETDTTKLKKLEPGVLGIFALKDNWITPQVVSTFEKNMKALGKRLIVKTFDADHAFANPSNPQYDKEATKQANQLSMAYLKSKLH